MLINRKFLKQALSEQWNLPKEKNYNPHIHKGYRDYNRIKEIQTKLNESK